MSIIEERKHIVHTAAFWFNAAHKAREEGKNTEAFFNMVNAYNHVENALAAQSAAPVGELTVEAWHGDRKVTVYKDVVLRIWGMDIDLDMSHEARSLETVQAAFDWLYAAPAALSEKPGEQP